MKESTVDIWYVDGERPQRLANVVDLFETETFMIFTRKDDEKYFVNKDQIQAFCIDPWIFEPIDEDY